jgi:hypothetical protein
MLHPCSRGHHPMPGPLLTAMTLISRLERRLQRRPSLLPRRKSSPHGRRTSDVYISKPVTDIIC